jgi:spore germination protein YaaH
VRRIAAGAALALGVAVAGVALAATRDGGAPPGPAPPPHVLAFVSSIGGEETRRLRAVGAHIDVAAPNWFALDARGRLHGSPDPEVRAAARERGVALWPVVNARSGGAGWLRSRRGRGRVARRIAARARRGRYPGMTLDLESIAPRDRRAYTALVRRTARLLHRRHRRLAVYVVRRSADPPRSSAAAYDWNALSQAADLVLASGYNEHGAVSPPGPVTTRAGFAAVLAYAAGFALGRVRIAPTLAGFGYSWPRGGGAGRLVSAAAAQREAGSPAAVRHLDSDGAAGYRTRGSEVWFESAAGLRERIDAARAAGMQWVALFSLGREPAEVWDGLPTARG